MCLLLQVDPEWLQRRREGGPTPEELATLRQADPLVTLKLVHFKPSTEGGYSTMTAPNFDLRASLDSSTLVNQYNLEIPVTDIFGEVLDDAEAVWTWQVAREGRRKRGSVMRMVS